MTLEWNNPPAFTCSRRTKEILKRGLKYVQEMCSRVPITNFKQVFCLMGYIFKYKLKVILINTRCKDKNELRWLLTWQ